MAGKKKKVIDKVRELLDKADEIFDEDKEKANEYVKKARKVAMKSRIRLPSELKRRFCKHCYSYLKPGKNSRVRVHEGKVIIYCSECKKYTRIPLNTT